MTLELNYYGNLTVDPADVGKGQTEHPPRPRHRFGIDSVRVLSAFRAAEAQKAAGGRAS